MSSEPETRAIIVSGTAVIAVCYGLGRYAYGLFVPQLQDALGLSAIAVGVIGGLSHVGYALGLTAAPSLTRRIGPGRVAAGAGVAAGVGMAGIAASTGRVTLGVAVLVAGLGSGLASPALAQVVVHRLHPVDQSSAQTRINSGTSIGLALSAPAVLLTIDWRAVWAIFAIASLATAASARAWLAERRPLPAVGAASHGADAAIIGLRSGGLLVYSMVLGATSATYWTFSRQQVLDAGMSAFWSAGFWVVIGVCGLAGGSAGASANRIGVSQALQVWGLVWVIALGVLAVPGLPPPVALGSAAGFGAAYMALTGLVILWAVSIYADDAAAGVRAAFVALGIGQAIGTFLTGFAVETWGLSAAFGLSAALSLMLILSASRARAPRQAAGGRRWLQAMPTASCDTA